MKERENGMNIDTIAFNAIDYMLCEAEMTVDEVCEYIGCTKKDLKDYGLVHDL